MIIDTSAMVAIMKEEPDADTIHAALIDSESPLVMSAATYLETGIVVDGMRQLVLSERLDQIIESYDIAIVPVTEAQARLARQAYRDFGKGSGHPASLNFGDCFAYALATERNEALLFKGNDLSHTGIRRA